MHAVLSCQPQAATAQPKYAGQRQYFRMLRHVARRDGDVCNKTAQLKYSWPSRAVKSFLHHPVYLISDSLQ